MTYSLAIFDFDGTLHDSFPWFRRVMNIIADRHRLRHVEPGEIDQLRGMSAREIIAHLSIPFWKLPLIARDLRRMKAAALDEIPLFPGADRMLRALSGAGITLAMVSSDDEANVRRALGPDMAALISHWDCGASAFGKPRKFRRVLRHAGLAAAEALCIGDELRDLEAARKAGIAFGAVSWGYTSSETLRVNAPDEIFFSFDDIVARLTQGR